MFRFPAGSGGPFARLKPETRRVKAMNVEHVREMAREIRKEVVRMHRRGPNVGSAMSAADLLAVLYFDVLRIAAPDDPARDRFFLSKGHAASALYAALALRGFLDRASLAGYLTDGSPLTGHPPCGLPGVEAATGSLGHGLPVAVGLALAAAQDGLPSRCFVLMGDGELQEGSVWEGASLAARLGLDRIVAIVDANNLQGYDRVDEVDPAGRFAARFRAFGWSVREVDGHDPRALSACLRRVPFRKGRPSAVIARTVKGKGVAEMEDQLGWHYFSVPEAKLDAFLQELEAGP